MQYTPTGRYVTVDIDVLRHGFVLNSPESPVNLVHVDLGKFEVTFQLMEMVDHSSKIIGYSPIQQATRNMRLRRRDN